MQRGSISEWKRFIDTNSAGELDCLLIFKKLMKRIARKIFIWQWTWKQQIRICWKIKRLLSQLSMRINVSHERLGAGNPTNHKCPQTVIAFYEKSNLAFLSRKQSSILSALRDIHNINIQNQSGFSFPQCERILNVLVKKWVWSIHLAMVFGKIEGFVYQSH